MELFLIATKTKIDIRNFNFVVVVEIARIKRDQYAEKKVEIK